MTLLEFGGIVLNRLAQALGILQFIQSMFGGTSANPQTAMILDDTHILRDIDAAFTDEFGIIEGKLDDILILLTDGNPVVLPTIPPSGYGAPDPDAVASAVWGTDITGNGDQAAQTVSWGAYAAINTRVLYDNINAARYFWPVYWSYNVPITGGITSPVFDPGDVLTGETSLDTLARQNPTATCDWWDGVGGHVHVAFTGTSSVQEWVTYFDDYEFVKLYSGGAVPVPLVGASLWPGEAGATLGSPVDLATGGTLTGPMNGVIVNLTSVPAKASWFDFDGTLSYRNLGQLAFSTDLGNFELAQSLGFTDAIYVPRSMVIAAGVKYRTVGGVVGTITPWVIA